MFVTIEKIRGKDCEYYGELEEALETPTRSESAGAARRRRLPSLLPVAGAGSQFLDPSPSLPRKRERRVSSASDNLNAAAFIATKARRIIGLARCSLVYLRERI